MKKNAFTLIELLAVIVILAIIALIAVPIVISIIENSKKSSQKESIKLYLDTVNKYVAKENMKKKYNPDYCNIGNDGNLTCNSNEENLGALVIEMSGKKPEYGTLYFSNGEVTSYKNVLINGTYYHERNGIKTTSQTEEYLCTRVSAASNTIITKGDKYTCKVNSTKERNFYVLTDPTDGKVNMIMDRNVCNDGSVVYTSTNNYCRYKWHAGENNNNYGPDTAMINLYNGTKDWINVPDMIMDYTDEHNSSSDTLGYTSIITNTNTKVTTITGKQNKTSDNQMFGNLTEPLKARLPKESEITGAGCTTNDGSCPVWLMEYMTYWDGANGKYSMNNNSAEYQNKITGYWLLSSLPGYSYYARRVSNNGCLSSNDTAYGNYGVRPVITVSVDDLAS